MTHVHKRTERRGTRGNVWHFTACGLRLDPRIHDYSLAARLTRNPVTCKRCKRTKLGAALAADQRSGDQ